MLIFVFQNVPSMAQQPPKLTFKNQMAILVEHHLRGQQLLTDLGARFPNAKPSVERVRAMTQAELQQHPDLWTAYVRGWEQCSASIPAHPPAFYQPAFRPPRAPFMGQQRFPAPRNQLKPSYRGRAPYNQGAALLVTPSSESAISVPGSTTSEHTASTSASQKLTYKQKKKQRMVEYRKGKKKELQLLAKELKAQSTPTSQQYRLDKKTEEHVTPPVPMPRSRPPSGAITPVTDDAPMDVEGATEFSENLQEEIETFLNPPPDPNP